MRAKSPLVMHIGHRLRTSAAFVLACVLGGTTATAGEPAAVSLSPQKLPAIGTVDPRFQSYNVEMVEIVGGKFWAPYKNPGLDDGKPSGGIDMSSGMFRKRDPLDMGNRRFRNLARALGPTYVRVGGAWANRVYFHDSETPPPTKVPSGFESILTRPQWAGVVAFSKANDARIVTSFGVSAGARDASGTWSPTQAIALTHYTQHLGGKIYAVELINEPNVGPLVGLPKGYSAETFGRDAEVFRKFASAPDTRMRTVGPASTGEAGFTLFPPNSGSIPTDALMTASPAPKFDIFAYHSYGAVSERCGAMAKDVTVRADQALSEEWLGRADTVFDYYKSRRDRFMPGAKIWVTEIAQAACGGDAWAATWLDTFRYVDQMARLAKRGVDVIFHNTLSASDYALIDDVTMEPRPSYWAAVLWARTMGTTVLDAGPLTPGLHVYAQCQRGKPGGVSMVAINLDTKKAANVTLGLPAQRYTLTAGKLFSKSVRLNGKTLAMSAADTLPPLLPQTTGRGALTLAPGSITFLTFPGAANKACR